MDKAARQSEQWAAAGDSDRPRASGREGDDEAQQADRTRAISVARGYDSPMSRVMDCMTRYDQSHTHKPRQRPVAGTTGVCVLPLLGSNQDSSDPESGRTARTVSD